MSQNPILKTISLNKIHQPSPGIFIKIPQRNVLTLLIDLGYLGSLSKTTKHLNHLFSEIIKRAKKSINIQCFFILSFFYLFIPQTIFSQSVGLKELLNKEKNLINVEQDSTLKTNYLELANGFLRIDSAKSNHYYKKYLDFVRDKKDTLGIGLYYYYQAINLLYDKKYEKAIDASRMCARLTKNRDNFFFLETMQIQIKSLHYMNRLEEAEKIGLELIRKYKLEKLPIQLAKIYFNLGLISMNRLNDSSINYFYKSIYYLSKDPDNKVLLPCYHHISCYYRDRNKLDSAVHYASLAFNLAKNPALYNNVDFISPATNYQELLARTGRHSEAQEVSRELQMKQYDLKVNSLIFPEVTKQVSYLEYLRINESFRLRIILIVSVFILIGLFFLIFFNRKLKRKQSELSESLELNRILMQETNHRVKNNFQMMMSMLSVNAGGTNAEIITPFVEQTRARIGSMAKVHDMFLQNQTGNPSDVQTFLREIIQSLAASLSLDKKNITVDFETNCERISPEKMLPLGLIINELVVNSVKYAFIGSMQGKINIKISASGNHYVLLYSDNGPGIEPNSDGIAHTGLSIVFSLAKQLKGEAHILKQEGTAVEITFKP